MFPILNPPPSSLHIPSFWVVPVHQPQASSIVRWLLNPAPSALWGADRVGTCGEAWGSLWLRWERQPGGVLCGSHVTTGVPRPGCTSLTATLKAGLWLPVTTSHLKVCALVTQCTSLPETQTSRSDWSHFGHFPYPQPPGHASMGGACGAQ